MVGIAKGIERGEAVERCLASPFARPTGDKCEADAVGDRDTLFLASQLV
jgi:hypothetical protein